MVDNTSELRQIQENPDNKKAGMSSLSVLFKDQDTIPREDALDAEIYVEHLGLLMADTDLSPSPSSGEIQSESTFLIDNRATPATSGPATSGESFSSEYTKIAESVAKGKDTPKTGQTSVRNQRLVPLIGTTPECSKFRILIIGQTGVGKSTLGSKILGISEESVSNAVHSYYPA